MASTQRICKAAKDLVKKTGTRDPFKICDRLDIHIRYHDLGESIKAYYFCQSRIKNIVINTAFYEKFGKLLCAHELGHAFLHDRMGSTGAFHEIGLFDATTPTEYEANLFAAELLIEDGEISEQIKNGFSFFDIARRLCLPPELVDFKLRSMNMRGFNISPPSLFSSDFLKNDITENR